LTSAAEGCTSEMTNEEQTSKPIVFTDHALRRMRERGAREEDVREAIRVGEREPIQRGLFLCRLNAGFRRVWDGRYYGVQQVVLIIDEEENRIVVVTVYTSYFQEGEER